MNYPLISEYIDAVRSAEDNFDQLRDLRPVVDDNGNPVMSSGNFAVVFKMKDAGTGKLYAVKCFIREQEGRREAYRKITEELEFVQSTYLAKVRYYDSELFVDSAGSADNEFPVLLMDWVDGTTLDHYVRQNLGDTRALEMLAYNFSRLAMWLLPQPFAHGDLKPDNILVLDDGSLTLVDYDGMFVPAMQGQKARELGSPDFRHPLRAETDFNEHIDDFPAISILLSLRLIASDPSLPDRYGASDRLLFRESDYRDLSSCSLLRSVFPSKDADINNLVGLFAIACAHKTLANVSFRLLAVAKPKKPQITIAEEKFSTTVTDDDRKNAIKDEFGAEYSPDWKRLIKGPNRLTKYNIKNGTKVICDKAFSGCNFLQQITIPESVISIGNAAFWGCESLQQITIPASVNKIGANPFLRCKCKITCLSPHFKVVDNVLYNADMTSIISCLSEKTSFTIPSSVISIGNAAFWGCESLQQITIPESVTNIGNYAFWGCESLQQITIPVSVNKIGANPFALAECKITCLSPHFKVVDNVLYNADMTSIISCFSEKTSFTIPSSVISIGNVAFLGCESLQQITIPKSVKSIDKGAFSWCKSLRQITIPESVKSIGNGAFSWCKSLQQITIPESVTNIGDEAFGGCESLQQIIIPPGSRIKFEEMLPMYKNKLIEKYQFPDDTDDLPF